MNSRFCFFLWKEYDYVFSVDIEDGKPHLKLPFNITGTFFTYTRFLSIKTTNIIENEIHFKNKPI